MLGCVILRVILGRYPNVTKSTVGMYTSSLFDDITAGTEARSHGPSLAWPNPQQTCDLARYGVLVDAYFDS
jgi:hypothetical protein